MVIRCSRFMSVSFGVVSFNAPFWHREAKQNASGGAEREGMKQRISEMQQFLAEQTQDITEYDEQLVRRLIEKITVYDEKVTVEFNPGQAWIYTGKYSSDYWHLASAGCFYYKKFIVDSSANIVICWVL